MDTSRTRCWLRVTLAIGLGAAVVLAPARAADPKRAEASLKLIPADAAFYFASLRNREQVEIIVKSNAWKQLTALPFVQQAWKKVQDEYTQPGGQLEKLREFYEAPDNAQLVALLADMFSHDVFIYGGPASADFADLFLRLASAMRFAPLQMQLADPDGKLDDQQRQALVLLRSLSNNLQILRAPDVVIGFKLSDTKQAEAQLKRLEGLLHALVLFVPDLKDRFKRTKVGGTEFLTLTLDGKLVPWEQVPIQQFEQQKGEFEPLLKKLKELKLTITVGVRDGYLLLSFDETTEALARLGKGKKLTERPELKPLNRFADRRLTSIGYLSESLARKVGTTASDIDQTVKAVEGLLAQAKLTAAQRAQIQKDLQELAKDLKAMVPEPGAALSYSFLTDRGVESYSHNWSQQLALDGSKPLTVLNHVGGSPLLVVAGRRKYSPESYDKLVKWIKVLHGYFEQYGLPQMPAEQKEQYEKVAKIARPLLERLNQATGKALLPALADGQSAFVLDARLTSKKWFKDMPAADQPLPMLEPALLFGVSDAALLRKAGADYRALLNDTIQEIRKFAPDVPDFQVPEPKEQKLKAGVMYFYPLPAELGLDRKLLPNAGLSDRFAVLTISREHTERLLTATPLKVAGGPLANSKRNLAAAVYFDWAGFVDALTPWVEYGIWQAAAQDPVSSVLRGEKPEAIIKQVRTGAAFLKVLRSHSSVSYFEDSALVTHGETLYKDL